MFNCRLCSVNFKSVGDTLNHLVFQHGLVDSPYLRISCCFDGCLLEFHHLRELKDHMIHHLQSPSIRAQQVGSRLNTGACTSTSSEPPYCTFKISKSPKDIKSKLSPEYKLALELDGTSIPKSTIEFIINKFKSFVNEVLQDITNHINNDKTQTIGSMTNYIQAKKLLLSKVDSKHKIEKIYENFPDYIPVTPIYLTTREKQIFKKKEKVRLTVPTACNFAYIPIIDTLGFILSTPGIEKLDLFQKYKESNQELVYKSLFDGSVFREGQLKKECENIILIMFFYDEFEPVNPLGSKTKKHKLGAFYMIILNLPDRLNSSLLHVHLIALFRTEDLKGDADLNSVLEPIVRDIKILENKGIKVGKVHYKVTIGAVACDNLGQNEVLQMVRSFGRSENYCNICEMDSKTARFSTRENIQLLRDRAKYARIIDEGPLQNKIHNLGIKNYCILNDLKYYHTCENFSGDIMHDLLEGAIPTSLKLFLNYIVESDLITLDELNARIYQFNFGILDSKNKPSPVILSKDGNLIGERAAQNWCLARYLPLIISDIIKSEKVQKHWEIVQAVLDITDVVLSPRITEASLRKLDDAVRRYSEAKIHTYERHIIPKEHFIQHYITLIKKMGPLYFLWCMRCEAKHNFFKDLIHKYRNFICEFQTLAQQHQRFMYNHWRLQEGILEMPISYNSKETKPFSSLLQQFNIAHENVESVDVTMCQGLQYGQKYYPGFFIVPYLEPNLPVFYRIEETFLKNNTPFCIAKRYKTTKYDELLHAFQIGPTTIQEYSEIDLSTLNHLYSYEQHQAYDSVNNYIVLRYNC